jgi:uncharacterized protein YecE (DUF72 family)
MDESAWHLGTMGFSYKEWQGVFYPAGLAARHYLAYYSERFDAVEIDSTFYGTPAPETVERWTAVTPDHFTFCPKTPRVITHEQRLLPGAYDEMDRFLDTMRRLDQKLGAVLIQLPPDFTTQQQPVLARFLERLPTDLRFAVEFRHRSWEETAESTTDLLQKQRICWATADYIHLSHTIRPTTDFLYLRFIGLHGQFRSKDREQVDKTAVLQTWWQQIQPHLPQMAHVYGFFNNDYAGYSPATCNRFKQIVGLEVEEIRPLQQGRLF